jgi:MFS family permease
MPTRLTPVQWLICTIAAIGFAFDVYELLMLPLIVGDALAELASIERGSAEFSRWVGILFFVPALFGGIFGLLGGYLTDRFGRRRVLVWSILLYAGSVLAAAFSTTLWQFLLFRCTTFIGVSVEFVAAVAWLAEIFQDPKQRERVLGYTQAFSSLGGIMIAQAYLLINALAASLPAIYGGPDDVWRYTLLSGFFPALPLLLIRPFLPESPVWQEKRAAGTLKRPSIGELFGPALRRTTIVTTLMMACAYGAAFGAIQQMPRIVPGLEEIAPLAVPLQREAAGEVQSWQELGGLTGRFALAMLVVAIAGRRRLLRLFQVPGLVVLPLVFATALSNDVTVVKIGMFFAGFFTVAQFSFWGNYLPRVFPTHLRGTGEGFAANIGGRMIGTSFAFVTTAIVVPLMSGSPPAQLAKASALVVAFVYVCGFGLSFRLPEPKSQDLPE